MHSLQLVLQCWNSCCLLHEKAPAVAEALASSISPHLQKPCSHCHVDFKPCDPLCNLKRCAWQRILSYIQCVVTGRMQWQPFQGTWWIMKAVLNKPRLCWESHGHPTNLHFALSETELSSMPCASCPWDVASVMLHAWLYMAANKTKSFLRESQKASQLSGEPSVGEFWAGRQESSYHSICSRWTKYKPVQESSVATYSQKGWSRRLNFVNSSTWKDFKETIAKHLKEVFQKCIRKETFSRRSR